MIDLLKKVLALVLRFLDWRKSTQRDREREDVRRAVVNHDRKAMNRILQERRSRHE